MIYENFDQLVAKVRASSKGIKTVAVVRAEDAHTLEAVAHATKNGVLTSLLIGDKTRIEEELAKLAEPLSSYKIVHAESDADAALKAAQLVNDGQAHFIMKGLLQTSDLMRALLSEQAGLRTGKLLSHLNFAQIPGYHKLVGITDTTLNICPDFEQKKAILENALVTMARMGFDTPKVAVLAANEQVSPKMPETVDAAKLKKMNEDGILPGCIIEGPLSYDLAIDKEAAATKKFLSPVCGDVDLILVPSMCVGNVLGKALRHSAGAKLSGFVVGGKVPIVLNSRAAEIEDKFLTLVLAASAAL